MPWLQVSVPVPAQASETVEAVLTAAGALSVTLSDASEDPIYEPPPGATPLWRNNRITGLFTPATDPETIRARVSAALGPDMAAAIAMEILDDRDWEREWLRHFQPLDFGQLWVCPAGIEAPAGVARLILDPGLAFGTGTHPTTALCLEWLVDTPPAGCEIVDYGCGSGILACAAALLGARSVIAVDNDPQALTATLANAARNGVADRVVAAEPTAPRARQMVDRAVANILAGPLRDLAATLAAQVRPSGAIALSGILAGQVGTVAAAYQPWFRLADPVERDGWCRLHGVRRASD